MHTVLPGPTCRVVPETGATLCHYYLLPGVKISQYSAERRPSHLYKPTQPITTLKFIRIPNNSFQRDGLGEGGHKKSIFSGTKNLSRNEFGIHGDEGDVGPLVP